jgi:hypothetical protein
VAGRSLAGGNDREDRNPALDVVGHHRRLQSRIDA